MRKHRYQVGTRDTNGLYRSVGVDATTSSEAKEIAVNRSSLLGVEVIAISVKKIRLGQ